MRAVLRQFRRAPGRILASIFALALAVGAIGVLAIPTVSEGTLHASAANGGLADIIVDTSPITANQIEQVGQIDGVEAAEGQALVAVELADGSASRLVGLGFESQTIDILQLDNGRLPQSASEVVASPGLAATGDTIVANGVSYDVVGEGGSLWWSDSDVFFADFDSVVALTPERGANRLVVTAHDDSIENLRAIGIDTRTLLEAEGDTYTTFPTYLPDGSTPIDEDIDMVSQMIGMLGIVAGLVALVLLASTTNTLITERTREVAVMRALGGRTRALRRRLRRISLGITGVALLIGLPFGIFVSNFIARMVLEEFVGITPDFAIDWWIVGGSAIAMLIGARLVSARAARRVTKQPLAEALRDRDGMPFGKRWYSRLSTRLAFGGLFGRLATRASLRRPSRTLAVVVQISAAVGAVFLIQSLTASINTFNAAAIAPWDWGSATVARDPGLPFDVDTIDLDGSSESGIWTWGEMQGWELEVYGLDPQTAVFDPMIVEGRWLEGGGHSAVLSRGFADRNDIAVGDDVKLELASGDLEYQVVGTSNDSGRAIYVDRADLASDLGSPGMANAVWSESEDPGLVLPVASETRTMSEVTAEDDAGRNAISLIFGAIGVIVAGVASLAVVSSMMVSLYERRHEMATLQALGSSRRRLRGLLIRELVPIGVVGIVGGIFIGALGNRGIVAAFEASNSIDIGVVNATGSIPAIVVGALLSLVAVAAVIVRGAARRPVAVTLRGAA